MTRLKSAYGTTHLLLESGLPAKIPEGVDRDVGINVWFANSGMRVHELKLASWAVGSDRWWLSKRIGDGPVYLRGGYKFVAQEAFIGFALNTF